MKRKRFNRGACGSSRGSYVWHSHCRYLEEKHLEFVRLSLEIKIPKRYFVRCFGKLLEITEREALMLGRTKIKVY